MTVATPYSTRLGIDRRRYPLGSNHAGMKSIHCRRCRTRFDAELFHRASEIFPEIFAELSVTFQNLTAAVETSRERLGAWQEASEEQPQTPQQRALPRPSTTPPMWAPRADGRRRR